MPSCCSAGVRMVIFAKNFPDVRNVLSVSFYSGQAAPPSIHVFICDVVSARERGGSARPVPGSHAQATSGSVETCSSNCVKERPPVCLGSFNCRHSSAGVRPTKIILCSAGGSDHLGFPGGMWAPGKFADWWQVSQRIPYTPWPSFPRFTFCTWTWLSSPCSGARAARKPGDRGNSHRRHSQQHSSPSPGVSSCAHDFASLPPASLLV